VKKKSEKIGKPSVDVAELLFVVFHFLLQIKQPIAANTFLAFFSDSF
jgi:hypothetical protein